MVGHTHESDSEQGYISGTPMGAGLVAAQGCFGSSGVFGGARINANGPREGGPLTPCAERRR
jgi:hypothetical protein